MAGLCDPTYLAYRGVRTLIEMMPIGLQPYALDMMSQSGLFSQYYKKDQ